MLNGYLIPASEDHFRFVPRLPLGAPVAGPIRTVAISTPTPVAPPKGEFTHHQWCDFLEALPIGSNIAIDTLPA